MTPNMWLTAAKTLTRLAELGERAGRGFTLENLNTAVDHPGTPFAKAADSLALIEAVDNPHLRLNLDLHHAQIGEGNLVQLVERALPYVGEIQVADVPGRCEPGTGEISYPAVAAALDRLGYTGVVGLEGWASDYLGALGVYDGGLIDLGWIAGFLLIGLAGLCREPAAPTLRTSGRLPGDAGRVTVPTSVLPYVPVLVALTVVVGVTLRGRPLTRVEMLVACAVVLCLLARQYLAVRDNVQLVQELAAREQELRRQAFSDPLTGLANRSLFRDRLEHVLELHTRDCRPVAVVFLDLDDFKAVNDGFGHAARDELLVRVAERITGATRAGDTVARLGGDEFAVLLEDAADPLQTAARICAALQPAFALDGAEHTVRASVGVAAVTADDPPVTADVLLARSDAAMYASKRAGKATIARFEAATGEVVQTGLLFPAPS